MTQEKKQTILKKAQALYYDLRNQGLTHQVAFRAVVDLVLEDRDWGAVERLQALSEVNNKVMKEAKSKKKAR